MEEEALLLKICEGRADALEAVIEQHYDKIYAYCYRHTGNKETAQDLTQDTFVNMLKNIHKYLHYGKFQNYLYVIASNLCKDYFKRKKPVYTADLPHELSAEEALDDFITVREAVAALPFKERSAVLLKYYHGLNINEIAHITNSTVSVTKYRLKRASVKLKNMLEGENE